MFYWIPFCFATLAKLQNWNNFEKLKASTYFSHLQLTKYMCLNLKVFSLPAHLPDTRQRSRATPACSSA